jgi:hypothetical protein
LFASSRRGRDVCRAMWDDWGRRLMRSGALEGLHDRKEGGDDRTDKQYRG